ncbi:hypothetical protein ACLB2K_022426 [Fragaria x ananassa]
MACAATYHCATPNRINSSPSNTGSRLNIKWNPPPQGQVKINFDDSVIQQTSDAECPLIASTRKLRKTTVLIAEATALKDSLLRAQEMGIQDLLVEGDFLLISNCVNGKFKCPWRLRIVSSFHRIHFQHNFCEANFAANALANLGHHCARPSFWDSDFPLAIGSAITFDLFGAGCFKGFAL